MLRYVSVCVCVCVCARARACVSGYLHAYTDRQTDMLTKSLPSIPPSLLPPSSHPPIPRQGDADAKKLHTQAKGFILPKV